MKATIKHLLLILPFTIEQECLVSKMPQTFEFKEGCCSESLMMYGDLTVNAAETHAYVVGMMRDVKLVGESNAKYKSIVGKYSLVKNDFEWKKFHNLSPKESKFGSIILLSPDETILVSLLAE